MKQPCDLKLPLPKLFSFLFFFILVVRQIDPAMLIIFNAVLSDGVELDCIALKRCVKSSL